MDDRNCLWLDIAGENPFPPLDEDLSVDVAIIGAGMVGLHCAWRLRDSGRSVAILEARQIGHQATGRSTAKVTSQHGLRYASLKRSVGEAKARLYASVNQRAVDTIAEICRMIEGEADLEPRDACLYAVNEAEARRLEEECEAARSLGLPAEMVSAANFPLQTTASLRFSGQYQFNPVAYLRGLAREIGAQARIYEQSRVTHVDAGEPCRLTVNGHKLTAQHLVVATHMPVVGEGMFFTKAFPFAHPVAAAPMPQDIALDGMFLSAGEPSRSFRTARHNGQTFLVAAGGEFKPGVPEQQAQAMEELVAFMRGELRTGEPTHRWINEDFRPMDGTALIGPATSSHTNIQVATGFNAWGITQGCVAGEIAAMHVIGEEHTAAGLYDATRIRPIAGGPAFISGNVQAAFHLIADRVLEGKATKLKDIAPGDAAVVTANGEQLAIRRDLDGSLHVLSAVCTHMGCVVDWNGVDRTWDCPCHGSRFTQEGEVLSGPATAPLEPRFLTQSTVNDAESPSTSGRDDGA